MSDAALCDDMCFSDQTAPITYQRFELFFGR